jgi:hypothetical protein
MYLSRSQWQQKKRACSHTQVSTECLTCFMSLKRHWNVLVTANILKATSKIRLEKFWNKSLIREKLNKPRSMHVWIYSFSAFLLLNLQLAWVCKHSLTRYSRILTSRCRRKIKVKSIRTSRIGTMFLTEKNTWRVECFDSWNRTIDHECFLPVLGTSLSQVVCVCVSSKIWNQLLKKDGMWSSFTIDYSFRISHNYT